MAPIFSPVWWPALAWAAPALAPFLAWKEVRFRSELGAAAARNERRTGAAAPLDDLPELEFIDLTPLVEYEHAEGFLGDPGVAYWIRTDRGSVLMDVGFGASRPSLAHNAARLGFTLSQVEAVVLSHAHPDHMGGIAAARHQRIEVPRAIEDAAPSCHAPIPCTFAARDVSVPAGPQPIAAGLATTGPLSRALFLEGDVEEQALVGRVRGKGSVVITGCGHPGLDVLVAMARRMVPGRVHAVVGGLHFPLMASRWQAGGVALQRLLGTGKAPWSPISDADLDRAVALLNDVAIDRLLLSAHDSCDHAVARFKSEVAAPVDVLTAGATVRI